MTQAKSHTYSVTTDDAHVSSARTADSACRAAARAAVRLHTRTYVWETPVAGGKPRCLASYPVE
jgi:hypothetical protein